MKFSFDVIAISEHKFVVGLKNRNYGIPNYNFCYSETNSSHGGTGHYNLSYIIILLKGIGLKIESPGELGSTFLEIFIPNKPISYVAVFTNIQIWELMILIYFIYYPC